jgi:hypothetical protein
MPESSWPRTLLPPAGSSEHTSQWGQPGKAQSEQILSAFPPIADMERTSLNGSQVPTADVSRCSKNHYSITSSARARSVGGISRPSAFAVLRLITSSNLVGCWIGKSAGLAPLRILST